MRRAISCWLNVVSQDIVYIGFVSWQEDGYGKVEPLKSAFHFHTTPATATSMILLMLRISGG
jgi:hypothetical protein